jgi:DNA-binding GntR family transcriptional regulator
MRKSFAENIIATLSKEILDGSYMPGEKLEEQVLADSFGVSRTPIREALRTLSSMGLVETRNRRGFKVSEVSIEELTQMFEMTGEIEALCARLAAQRMTPIERTELKKIHEACFQAAQTGDVNDYLIISAKQFI